MLSKLVKKYKKYFFRYRKGFYELPFIANSPQAVTEGFIGAPLIKYVKARNSFSMSNLFITAYATFQELEEGLWVYYVDVLHKKQIKYMPYYDEDITDNYYVLSLNEVRNNFRINVRFGKKEFYVQNAFYTFFKPLSNVSYFNNKNSSGSCVNIYFSAAWLAKNIVNNPTWQGHNVLTFLKAITGRAAWYENTALAQNRLTAFKEAMSGSEIDLKKLKANTLQLIKTALHHFNNDLALINYFQLHDGDREYLFKVEKYLIAHLTANFAGVDFISRQFSISPTKLKSDFKTQYGASIFQYFREKQMQLACQLLKTNNYSIAEVGSKLGYDNASKFAAAFKEVMGILPSELS